MPDEERLIQRARGYDPQALALLYRRHVGAIYRYIHLRVGREDLAEDLTADVFLKMLEGIESFDYRGVPFAAWLFRIAHDRVVDYFRRQAGKETVSLREGLSTSGEGPVAITEAALARERLRQAFGQLTEEQQQVIVLKFGEGLTNAEVGWLLGKSEGAVKSLQHRALATLRRFLEEQGRVLGTDGIKRP